MSKKNHTENITLIENSGESRFDKKLKSKRKKVKKGILGVPVPAKRDRILFLINVSIL